MRHLCIDLGDKRTGLALGDNVTKLASPLKVILIPIDQNGGEALLTELASIIDRELAAADTIVLGLAINIDGTEGPRAKLCREFAAKLAGKTGRPVHLADERRTSLRADELMSQSGLTHKQKKLRRDAIAAAAILQGVLDGEIATEVVDPPV